ncbi:formate dehydrogenase subunit delta [Sheuella amnicola]|nr:formate dehydrogenase subunit delta [Sheuella amnicola]
MANRIGDFFEAMPDRDRALHDAIEHLRKFWEPRMRQELRLHVERTNGKGLSPFMTEALSKHPF